MREHQTDNVEWVEFYRQRRRTARATLLWSTLIGLGVVAAVGDIALSSVDPRAPDQVVGSWSSEGGAPHITRVAQVPYGVADRDCRDFGSWEEAQDFMENSGDGDPHRLDGDDDGIACERLR